MVQIRCFLTGAVGNSALQFGLFRSVFTTGRDRLRSLLILSLLALVGGSNARGAQVPNAPTNSAAPSPQFAIDDFDGDLRPDIASIQSSPSDFFHTDYWIQLQLSASGRQSIRVVGPAGGLTIEARDVNGDHAVDLVLSTAWRRLPVAILLNDGHGRFSRVEPTIFPDAFTETGANWTSRSNGAVCNVGVPSESRDGRPLATICLRPFKPHADSIAFSNARFFDDVFFINRASRAPPSETHNL